MVTQVDLNLPPDTFTKLHASEYDQILYAKPDLQVGDDLFLIIRNTRPRGVEYISRTHADYKKIEEFFRSM
jgi:hypothetical protein